MTIDPTIIFVYKNMSPLCWKLLTSVIPQIAMGLGSEVFALAEVTFIMINSFRP